MASPFPCRLRPRPASPFLAEVTNGLPLSLPRLRPASPFPAEAVAGSMRLWLWPCRWLWLWLCGRCGGGHGRECGCGCWPWMREERLSGWQQGPGDRTACGSNNIT